MNELIYESIPLNLLIKKYDSIQFEYGGYTYSDKYIPPKENQRYGSYILNITTREMFEQGQLNGSSIRIRQHAEFVMMLIKYITGTSLFDEQKEIDLRRKRFFIAGECPNGWSSNYKELNDLLDCNPIKLQIKHLPSRPYAIIPVSPLYELRLFLMQYNRMSPTIR